MSRPRYLAALDAVDLPLFGAPDPFPPFARGSVTSKLAAAEQVPQLSRLQAEYLAALRQYGGLTDHDAARYLGRPLSSVNARRNECQQLGKVRASTRTAMSPFGRQATVWEINEGGQS